MKSINTSDLNGAALEWAVAKAEGAISQDVDDFCLSVKGEFAYPTNWALGGAIIEREAIALTPYGAASTAPKNPEYWEACMHDQDEVIIHVGDTPLVAAMRCYVASVLGSEVEVPDECFAE